MRLLDFFKHLVIRKAEPIEKCTSYYWEESTRTCYLATDQQQGWGEGKDVVPGDPVPFVPKIYKYRINLNGYLLAKDSPPLFPAYSVRVYE